MNLSFFEKNIFDPAAREKPTISTNDNVTDLDNIKSDYKKTYKSNPVSKILRNFLVPIEFLPFYQDGTKFVGEFKKVEVTSGEPEIISRVQAAEISKAINVNFEDDVRITTPVASNNANIVRNLIEIPRLIFEPILDLKIGSYVSRFLNGFNDSIYKKFKSFFLGSSSDKILWSGGFQTLNKNTPPENLPGEIHNLQTEQTGIRETIIWQGIFESDLLHPISSSIVYNITYIRQNIYSFRDFCLLKSGGSNVNIISPVVQNINKVITAGNRVNTTIPSNLNMGNFNIVNTESLDIYIQNESEAFGNFNVSTGSAATWHNLSDELRVVTDISNIDSSQTFTHRVESRFSFPISSFLSVVLKNIGSIDSRFELDSSMRKIFFRSRVVYVTTTLNWTITADEDDVKRDIKADWEAILRNEFIDALSALQQRLYVDYQAFAAFKADRISLGVKDSDFVSPFLNSTLDNPDLGLPANGTDIELNGIHKADLSLSYRELSGVLRSREVSYIKLNSGDINFYSSAFPIPLRSSSQILGEDFLSSLLPIPINSANQSFQIVHAVVGKPGEPDNNVFFIQRSDQTQYEDNDITELQIIDDEGHTNDVTVRNIAFQNFMYEGISTGKILSSALAALFIIKEKTFNDWRDLEQNKSFENVIRDLTIRKKTFTVIIFKRHYISSRG